MFLTPQLKEEIFTKLSTIPCFIVGSFSTAIVENMYYLQEEYTTEFHDIDILCVQQTHKNCMELYNYFKEKYDIPLSFNWYSPQLVGCEEVIQEASLFNINRFLIDVRRQEVIYDKNTFKNSKEIIDKYRAKDITVNPDCCTYYYRNFEENIKQLNKYPELITEEVLENLEKPLRFVIDEKYINDFYDSKKRYSVKPKEDTILKEKPQGEYFIKYFDIKNKFDKEVIKIV